MQTRRELPSPRAQWRRQCPRIRRHTSRPAPVRAVASPLRFTASSRRHAPVPRARQHARVACIENTARQRVSMKHRTRVAHVAATHRSVREHLGYDRVSLWRPHLSKRTCRYRHTCSPCAPAGTCLVRPSGQAQRHRSLPACQQSEDRLARREDVHAPPTAVAAGAPGWRSLFPCRASTRSSASGVRAAPYALTRCRLVSSRASAGALQNAP